jgi:hypothetical protein
MSGKPYDTAKLFAIWILANLVGLAVLATLVWTLPSLRPNPGLVVSALIITVPIGLPQWIALRRFAPVSALWLLTLPVGLALGVLACGIIPAALWPGMDDESIAGLTVCYVIIGLAIGLPQWLLLRRRFANSSIWLLGSSAGLGVGFGLVLATGLINMSEIMSYVVVMLVYASLTGLVLAQLVGHKQAQSHLAGAN